MASSESQEPSLQAFSAGIPVIAHLSFDVVPGVRDSVEILSISWNGINGISILYWHDGMVDSHHVSCDPRYPPSKKALLRFLEHEVVRGADQ